MKTIEQLEKALEKLDEEKQLLTVDEIDTIHFETFFRNCLDCNPDWNLDSEGCEKCFGGTVYYLDWENGEANDIEAQFSNKLLEEGCILVSMETDGKWDDLNSEIRCLNKLLSAASKLPFCKIEQLPEHMKDVLNFSDNPVYAFIFPKSYVSVLMAAMK